MSRSVLGSFAASLDSSVVDRAISLGDALGSTGTFFVVGAAGVDDKELAEGGREGAVGVSSHCLESRSSVGRRDCGFTDASLIACAAALGFSSDRHFIAAFEVAIGGSMIGTQESDFGGPLGES